MASFAVSFANFAVRALTLRKLSKVLTAKDAKYDRKGRRRSPDTRHLMNLLDTRANAQVIMRNSP